MTIRNLPKKTTLPFKNLTIFFIALLFLPISWQCISPPDLLGEDLIPSQDLVNVKVDTSFELSAYTVKIDTFYSVKFTDATLGETYDGVFGRTQASFLTQLRLGLIGHDFGTVTDVNSIDSAFIYLKLKDKLGNEPISAVVYELTDSISSDSLYSAFLPVDEFYGSTIISDGVNTYNGDESFFKIRLKHDWVYERLIGADSVSMSTQDEFIKYFKGIYVVTEGEFPTHAKGMYHFDYLSAETRMTVYYKNEELTADDGEEDLVEEELESLNYSYTMNTECQRFHHFKHDLEAADEDLAIPFTPMSEPQDSVFYFKGLGSVRGVIVLDDIVKWTESMPLAISRAELRIEIEDHQTVPNDTLVNQLYMFAINNYKLEEIIDYTLSQETFGGGYSKSRGYYSFNITHHLQSLLKSNEPNPELYIQGSDSNVRAGSAVLRSGNHPNGKMKLIITYIKM